MGNSSPNFQVAPLPKNEVQRISALKEFNVLDTPPEILMDDITIIASKICSTPVALISLVDENRQWFKSKVGIEAEETPRDIAFCAHAIHEDTVFVVEDATLDPRFRENPLVTGPTKVRFYAGAPLKTSSGYNIGTLCVIDHKPRQLADADRIALEALARQVIVNFERKLLATKLETRESFLTNILAMLPDLVSYIDSHLCYRYVNPAYEKWFQLDFTKIVGLPMKEVLGAKAFEAAKPYILRALAGERLDFQLRMPYLIEEKIQNKFVQAHYIPDKKPNGEIAGIFAVVTDVTQLKEAEELATQKREELAIALEESKRNENSFRAIFENAPVGIIHVDKNLNYISVNPAYEKLLGYSEEELRKMNVLDLTAPEDREITTASRPVYGNKKQLRRLNKRYIHKSGKVVWVDVSSRSVKLTSESEEEFFTVIEDVTEIQELQHQLDIERQKSIQNAKLASLGEMSAGIAHEINNPLTIISATLSNLHIFVNEPDKIKMKVENVQKAVDRIAKIVRGLRKFSRTAEPTDHIPESLSKILRESIVLVEAKAKKNDVSISLELNESLVISCSEIEMEQVFINLLNNSIDAVKSLPERWIKLTTKLEANDIIVQVTDSGKGIPKALKEKLFQPFFTTKPIGEGTGIGLSITKGILEEHNATIELLDKSENTCFELKFKKA